MSQEATVGRITKVECKILQALQQEAAEATRGAQRAMAILEGVKALLFTKYGFADNIQIDLETGDATVREQKPGKKENVTPLSQAAELVAEHDAAKK